MPGPESSTSSRALPSCPRTRTSTRAQLEEKLYGWKDEISSNAVEVYVHSLRKKLGAEFIRNIRGMGYVLARDDGAAGGEPA